MLKPGIKTSELLLAVLTDIGAVTAAIVGNLPAQWAAVVAAISTLAYSLARGLAKMTPPVVAVTGTAPSQTVTPPTA